MIAISTDNQYPPLARRAIDVSYVGRGGKISSTADNDGIMRNAANI